MRIIGVSFLLAVMVIAGCEGPIKHNLPPSQMMMHPGPGVDGPGPGVMAYQPSTPPVAATSQIAFLTPEGMQVQWDVTAPGRFDSEPLIMPGRSNFPQGAIYRLKISNIPAHPGVELYPTLEVGPALPKTEAFLAHNAIPVQFTDEDFDQVLSSNFVTKVIYLPNPEHQELALAGVETLVSTRLEPGTDPIVEATRNGSILAVVRLGNKDLQIPAAAGSAPAGEVTPTSYQCPASGMGMQGYGCPMGVPVGGGMPFGYVSGVTGPQYGMPMCGTPIGLPGPPHIPLGVPAGLQRETIVNHTHVNLPEPTHSVRIDVKQKPGYSYPEPPNHVRIVERTRAAEGAARACPAGGPVCAGPACPTGGPACPVTAGDPGSRSCTVGSGPQ